MALTSSPCQELIEIRHELQETLGSLSRAHDARIAADLATVERLASQSLETGDQTTLVLAVVNLLSGYHERRNEWDARLNKLWDRVGAVVDGDRLLTEEPVPKRPRLSQPPTTLLVVVGQ